ncbi:MAG: acetyl-coenzyme A synthetase, partial [Ilumatobacteraceae bacterium]|nr:acetyl-coenzyme A synthetase [Ilumatobacteraceae bacterium]
MADNENHDTIDALQWEKRTFPPSDAFKKNTLVAGTFLYDEANEDYEAFWARQASELVSWDTEWDTICEWKLPYSKWFVGGQLNVSYNCLDRHVIAGKGEKVAFHFEGEPGDTRTITYSQMLDEV